MPRRARIISQSGYSHVILKGIGGQLLFEEKMDYEFFLRRMERYSIDTNVTICAYCLMNNHVHILAFDKSDSLDKFIKKIGVSYSIYFNKKYDRVGHLFQDRYKSIPIETDEYLITVFRYILNNPEKAGISRTAEYEWSSYNDYKYNKGFTDAKLIRDLLRGNKDFDSFLKLEANDSEENMEYDTITRDDNWALKCACDVLGIDKITDIQSWKKEERNKAIDKMYHAGITISQISRISGLGRDIIRRNIIR